MSVIQAAVVTPVTGPLAMYGQAGVAALRIWAEAAANLPPPWLGVQLEVHDAHPDPATAMREAAEVHPDVIFGPYGTSPAVAAIRATDRVVWNHGGAASQLAWKKFPKVINVLSPASSYYVGALEAIKQAAPEAGTVSIFHARTGFGRDVADGAKAAAKELGFAVRAVAFTPEKLEQAAAKVRDADVLLVAGGFDGEMAAAKLLLSRPWRAVAFVGAGVDEVLAPLGSRREGLLGPAQWTLETAPTPDTGPEARWFAAQFSKLVRCDPAYPAVQAFAAGVLWSRCMREADSVEDDKILKAAKRLRCTTLYGGFALDRSTGLQVGHKVLTVQWQDGARRVVWPRIVAERRLAFPRDAGT